MVWKLAFENDRNGNTVNGSESALIAALSSGATLKICVVGGDSAGNHLHIFTPNSVIVRHGNVYAQTVHFGGHWKQDDTTILDLTVPLVLISENICSSGRIVNVYSTEGLDGKTSIGKDITSAALRWFVEE